VFTVTECLNIIWINFGKGIVVFLYVIQNVGHQYIVILGM
jgi:hypothetical protein